MTPSNPFGREFAGHQLHRVYDKTLTSDEIRWLRHDLEENEEAWEDFLSAPGEPHELSSGEADDILQAIMQEVDVQPTPSIAAPQPATPSFWQTWLMSWRTMVWAPVALALMLFVIPWGSNNTVPSGVWTGKKNGSQVRPNAYLHVSVQSKQSKKYSAIRPFQQNSFYELGDIFYFRFLVIEQGYVYLYRQDASGNLKQLFPFQPNEHKLYKGGRHYVLQQQGRPVPYFLDRDVLGHQTFWLIQSPKPLTLPPNRKQLTKQQKALLFRADRIQFTVLPRLNRTVSPR